MEFLKKSWAQIGVLFNHLSPSDKWLIAALTVVLVLVGILVMQYAAAPEMVSITEFAGSKQTEAASRLRDAGIKTEIRQGRLLVSADKRFEALGVLQRGELLAPDTSLAFDELIKQQNPWWTNAQNAQAFLLAKQKVLGQIVGKMAGVQSADVLISMPADTGFGRSHTRPSASVNMVMQTGRRVEKPLVEAVAGLVAGGVAGMTPQDVVIIDAHAGRQFTVKSALDVAPGETLEHVQALERYHREKIMDVLRYIPDVIVAVNVQTDPTIRKQEERVEYEKTEPLRKERTRETENRSATSAGAPGVASNNGLDIEGASAAGGGVEKTSESETEFGSKNPVLKTSSLIAGRTAQQISVTVNVPRSYILQVYKQSKGGDAAKPDAPEPDDAALEPIKQAQLTQIQAQVEPLISTTAKGVVKVSMILDAGSMLARIGGNAGSGGSSAALGGGIGSVMASDWIKPAGLATLALVSVVLMLTMVRKATQAPTMPSIQELAGVPPTLPSDDDLVGEAEETDQSMAGVELDEGELRNRKITEQIGEMIKSNPTEAAALIRRWVRTEE